MNNAVTASAAGVYILDGKPADAKTLAAQGISEKQLDNAYKGTMAYAVLSAHNTLEKTEKGAPLKIKFDAMASHDITYVGIIQNAKASGLEKFPLPYVLTNCHNSLCAVGGTINEDDHVFGLSAAKRYGGIFVPPHQAVIHTYMREQMSGCGRMILGSDSHTVTARWAPWLWARAVPNSSNNCWAGRTISTIPTWWRWCSKASPQRAWVRRTWLFRS